MYSCCIKPLGHPDILHLRAAEGWMEIGNHHLEADKELDKITAPLRGHPDVLQIRWHVYAHAEKWEACLDIATALVKLAPDSSDGWVHRSYSLHQLKRTQEAFDILLPALEKFPRVWNVPYNLACYCAQLGRLDEAKSWFKKAMAIDEHTVKREALDDPDLIPLWDSMSGTIWKRCG